MANELASGEADTLVLELGEDCVMCLEREDGHGECFPRRTGGCNAQAVANWDIFESCESGQQSGSPSGPPSAASCGRPEALLGADCMLCLVTNDVRFPTAPCLDEPLRLTQ